MPLIERLLGRLFPPAIEPAATLRHRAGERVTVRGRVVPREPIVSPLSGERCVYYRYLVEEWRASSVPMGTNGGLWVAVERDEAICEFYLEDDSGRALVMVEEDRVEVDGAGVAQRVEVPQGQRASELRIVAGDLVEIHGAGGEIADTLDESRGYREEATRGTVRAVDEGSLRIRLLRT
jgi:hypothetical protein